MPLTRPARFGLKDWKTGKDIEIRTNWNKIAGNNKYLDLRIGGIEVIIETEELKSILLLLLPDKEAVKFANIITHTVKRVPVSMTLTRDAYKGEQFHGTVSVEL